MSKQKKQNKVFVIGFVLISIVILWALARPVIRNFLKNFGEPEKVANEEIVNAPFISAKDLFEKMKSENFFVVDLRNESDFLRGHVAGAVNIPVSDFSPSSLAKEKVEKTASVVLSNQGGNIVEIATKTNELVSAGYPNAKYLEGGISSWQDQGYPVVSSGGLEIDKNKIKTVSIGSLEEELLSGEAVQFVDLRSVDEFAIGHIPGALNVPFSEIEKRAKEISSVKKVVVYGNGNDVEAAAVSLFDLNFLNVYILSGGLQAWKAADGKLE